MNQNWIHFWIHYHLSRYTKSENDKFPKISQNVCETRRTYVYNVYETVQHIVRRNGIYRKFAPTNGFHYLEWFEWWWKNKKKDSDVKLSIEDLTPKRIELIHFVNQSQGGIPTGWIKNLKVRLPISKNIGCICNIYNTKIYIA